MATHDETLAETLEQIEDLADDANIDDETREVAQVLARRKLESGWDGSVPRYVAWTAVAEATARTTEADTK